MSKAHRIDKSVLDESLVKEIERKAESGGPISWNQIVDPPQLADGNWKPPVATFDNLPLENNNFGDIRLVLDINMVYTWKDTFWDEVGANDPHISWVDIKEKPVEFTPSAHEHTWLEITGKPSTFTPSVHEHTMSDIIDLDVYTKSEIDILGQQFVFKVPGKDLSTNDFTEDDKMKLDSLSESASIDYQTMLNTLNGHTDNQEIHLSQTDIEAIASISGKATKAYVDGELVKKAESTTLSGHTSNGAIHVTGVDKGIWNNGITSFSETQPTSGIWFKEVL